MDVLPDLGTGASLSRRISHRSGSTALLPSEAFPALLSGFLHLYIAVYAVCQVARIVVRKATRQGSSDRGLHGRIHVEEKFFSSHVLWRSLR